MRIILPALAVIALFSCTKEEITEVTEVTQVSQLESIKGVKQEKFLCFFLDEFVDCEIVTMPDSVSLETHKPIVYLLDELDFLTSLPTTIIATESEPIQEVELTFSAVNETMVICSSVSSDQNPPSFCADFKIIYIPVE